MFELILNLVQAEWEELFNGLLRPGSCQTRYHLAKRFDGVGLCVGSGVVEDKSENELEEGVRQMKAHDI